LPDLQSTGNSYQHAMRAPKQKISDARRLMIDFVNANKENARRSAETARSLLAFGNPAASGAEGFIVKAMTEAVHHLGRAQHPLADMTSPLHAGFQEWKDIMTVSGAYDGFYNHHKVETKELYNQQYRPPATFVINIMDSVLDEILRP
jgi:hypothetical protein